MTYKKGFTSVEVLVVIALIGVLVALLLPAIMTAREHYKEEAKKEQRNTASTDLVQSLRMKAQSLLAEKDKLQAEFDKLHEQFTKGPIEIKITGKPDEEGSWWVESTIGNEPEYSMVEVKLHKDRYDLLTLCIRTDDGWVPVDVWLKINTKPGNNPPRFSPLTEVNPFAR